MIGIQVMKEIIPCFLRKPVIDRFGGVMFCQDIGQHRTQYKILMLRLLNNIYRLGIYYGIDQQNTGQ